MSLSNECVFKEHIEDLNFALSPVCLDAEAIRRRDFENKDFFPSPVPDTIDQLPPSSSLVIEAQPLNTTEELLRVLSEFEIEYVVYGDLVITQNGDQFYNGRPIEYKPNGIDTKAMTFMFSSFPGTFGSWVKGVSTLSKMGSKIPVKTVPDRGFQVVVETRKDFVADKEQVIAIYGEQILGPDYVNVELIQTIGITGLVYELNCDIDYDGQLLNIVFTCSQNGNVQVLITNPKFRMHFFANPLDLVCLVNKTMQLTEQRIISWESLR